MDAYRMYGRPGRTGDTCRFYFRSEKSRLKYAVEAVYHREGDFYAVKFHAKAHSTSPCRYGLATNTGEPFTVLRTCMQAVPRLLDLRPTASFAAIGAGLHGGPHRGGGGDRAVQDVQKASGAHRAG